MKSVRNLTDAQVDEGLIRGKGRMAVFASVLRMFAEKTDIAEMARQLDVERSTVYRFMEILQLPPVFRNPEGQKGMQ